MAPMDISPQVLALGVAAAVGGSVAGILDIFAGAAINRVNLAKLLQIVASGILGSASYEAAGRSVTLGFFLQIAMSILIAAIYAFSGLIYPALLSSPIRYGALYGVVIFVVMGFVVVPLSAVSPKPKPTPIAALLQLIAMIGFGLIVAWAAHLAGA